MRRLILSLLPAILAVAALTACGGSDSDSDAPASNGTDGELVPVTLAALAVANAAPLVLGEQQGIFEENGIELTIEFVEAAAVVPGVLSGDYQFGYLNAPAVLAARANGVPIKSIITMANNSGDSADFPLQIVVPTNSDIASPEDLVGKTVATDTLFQLPDLGMRAALLAEGVDPEELQIIEIPFAEMGTALQEGNVDAAVITEPFGTILRDAGAVRDLLSTSTGQEDGSPQAVMLSSEQYISENPETVEKMQSAVDESLVYAAENDEDMRATLPEFTPLDPELTGIIRIAPPSSEDSPEGWQAWADLLVEVGVLDAAGDATEAYVEFDG